MKNVMSKDRAGSKTGFTLIETTIVLAVAITIMSFISINLFKAKSSTSESSSSSTLVTDLNQQRLKAMTGTTRDTSSSYGVFFDDQEYVLFKGMVYDPNSPTNYTVELGDGIEFINGTFPNNIVVFNHVSGDVATFSAGFNTITLNNTQANSSTTLTINRLGTITSLE